MSDDLVAAYLDDLLTRFHYLDLRGIAALERVVEPDDVCVPLRVAAWGEAARPKTERIAFELMHRLAHADPATDPSAARDAIFDPGVPHTETLRTFAENPLLLTILALVKP